MSRLQSCADDDCRLFQKIAEQGHYAGRSRPSGTRQGHYAAAPSGVLLASINSNNADRVLAMMQSALEKWRTLPKEERLLANLPSGGEAIVGWQKLYPKDGLVLTVTSRDLEREAQPQVNWQGKSHNQDYAWFSKSESAQLVPESAKVGVSREIPEELVKRLFRLHLVDNVRGETQPFPVNGVEKAILSSRVTGVTGDSVNIHLSGEARLTNEGMWSIAGFRDMETPSYQKRGYESKLLGRAAYDRKAGRFTSFEMLSVGMRWGATQYNGRTNDRDPAPMAVAFTLAGETPAERVPPAFLHAYGWR